MAWTQTDLDKLEAAMAEGVLRVKYKDKEIEYRSHNQMQALRDAMKKEIKGTKRTIRVQACFDKGL